MGNYIFVHSDMCRSDRLLMNVLLVPLQILIILMRIFSGCALQLKAESENVKYGSCQVWIRII